MWGGCSCRTPCGRGGDASTPERDASRDAWGRAGTLLRIRAHTREFRRTPLSNESLRAAIHQAGLEVDQLADAVEVDVKTVRRWLAGRTPRGRYRTRVAHALNTNEQELWPELDLPLAGRDERGEILAAYAHASDLQAPDWRALLPHARHHIDLLDPTLHHVLSGPGTPDLLRERANAGCQIRLLLSAPDSAHLVLADREHGERIDLLDIPDSAREAEHTLAIAQALTTTDGVQARTYIAASPHTLLRFDDDLLLAIHLYSVAGDEAPLLHLKRHSDHGLFQRFTAHYQALWDDAQPLTPPNPAS